MTVRATATVTGVSENGKLITFRVEASDDWGPIGEGTHTRAIIANDRFTTCAPESSSICDETPAGERSANAQKRVPAAMRNILK